MAKALYYAIAVVGIGVAGGLAYLHQTGQWRLELGQVATPAPPAAAAGPVAVAPPAARPGSPPAAPGAGPPGRAGGGPVAVEVGQVRAVSIQAEVQSVGTLLARQGVVVRPEVAGRIARLGFNDGQAVRRGQVLVQLDDALESAEVQQAQAQLSIAQASVQRNRELVAQNFVSKAALDESVASLQVAQARLQVAQARQQRMRIVAPFDGVMGIRQVNVGDYVGVGAAIASLDDIGQVLLDFRLPERFLSGLQRGQVAEVQVDALPGRRYTARVEAIDPQVDVNGRSVLVRARLENTQGDLRPGMFARVRALIGERSQAIMVPEEAIVPQGGRQWVVLVLRQPAPAGAAQDNGTPQVRLVSKLIEVELGTRREGMVEVTGAVKPGDTVVTAGQQRVPRDGMALRIVHVGERAPAEGAPRSGPPAGPGGAA